MIAKVCKEKRFQSAASIKTAGVKTAKEIRVRCLRYERNVNTSVYFSFSV